LYRGRAKNGVITFLPYVTSFSSHTSGARDLKIGSGDFGIMGVHFEIENWDFILICIPYPGEKLSLPWSQARTQIIVSHYLKNV